MKTIGTAVKIDEVVDWITRRFGAKNSDTSSSEIAKYLRYLCACEFIKKSPYNPYESSFYTVAHSLLTPPKNFADREPNPTSKRSPPKRKSISEKVTIHNWVWRSYWPPYEEIQSGARISISTSAYEAKFTELLDSITLETRNMPPKNMAEEFEDMSGVPHENTLQFLIDIGLVFKTKKTIFVQRFIEEDDTELKLTSNI